MIQNYFHNVKRFLGSLISNARAREDWGKRIYLFSFLKIGGSPAERAKAGGQKGKGFRGRNFCPPAVFGGIPAAPQARQSVNFVQNRFGFGCINAPESNLLYQKFLMLDSAAPAARHKTATARGQKFPPPNPLHFYPLAKNPRRLKLYLHNNY